MEAYGFPELASGLEALNRPKRLLLLGWGVFSVIVGLVGAWLALSGLSFDFAILLIAGVPGTGVICFAAVIAFPSAPMALSIGDSAASFRMRDGSTRELHWADPPSDLLVYDMRPLGSTWEDNVTPRTIDFVLISFRSRLRAAIPLDAMRSLVMTARENGVVVLGWEDTVSNLGPPIKVRFRARPPS